MPAQTKITDEQLKEKLMESHLEEQQKNELAVLIPYMSDEDRNQLLALIDKSYEVKAQEDKANIEYADGMNKLNAEYDEKMTKLTRDFTTEARKEYENLEHQESSKTLKKLEDEIKNI